MVDASSNVWKGLAFGGISAMLGDLVTMPIDVSKTRLQLAGAADTSARSAMTSNAATPYAGRSALGCALHTARHEGVAALWKGLSPALWRQASYGSLKYGLYTPIKSAIAGPGDRGANLPLPYKILSGGLSGTVAQAIANPTDLVKVRMMAEVGTPRPEYRSFPGALRAIVRADGVRGLYRGLGPNVGRAAVLTAAELASYDAIHQEVARRCPGLRERGGLALHTPAALAAGFLSAAAANPFDFCKSRMMGPSAGAYDNAWHCARASVAKDGVRVLWTGFVANWARIGPRVVVVFLSLEQLKQRFG